MKILFLSGWAPYPSDNGSKLRIFNLLRALAAKHRVTLVAFSETGEAGAPPAPLADLCRGGVVALPYRDFQPASRRALAGLLSVTPRWLVDTYRPAAAAAIREQVAASGCDVVIASQWRMAAYAQAFAGPPALFEEVELGVFQSKIAAAAGWRRVRHWLPWLKLGVFVRRLLPRFRACTVVSEEEKLLLAGLAPGYGAVHVVPNGIALDDYAAVPAVPQPDTLIFTGSLSYHANYDAMVWFLEAVWPRVRAARPGARLAITGKPGPVPLAPVDGVTYTGWVEDIRPLVASAWGSLAPLRLGGGTRLKILEAMALHTPVVATTKGAEGLNAVPGEHLLAADDPEEFAAAVIRLLAEPALRAALARQAYDFVRTKYNWPVLLPAFSNLVETLC